MSEDSKLDGWRRMLHDDICENQLWSDIRHAADTDEVLQDMLNQIKMYYQLKTTR